MKPITVRNSEDLIHTVQVAVIMILFSIIPAGVFIGHRAGIGDCPLVIRGTIIVFTPTTIPIIMIRSIIRIMIITIIILTIIIITMVTGQGIITDIGMDIMVRDITAEITGMVIIAMVIGQAIHLLIPIQEVD